MWWTVCVVFALAIAVLGAAFGWWIRGETAWPMLHLNRSTSRIQPDILCGAASRSFLPVAHGLVAKMHGANVCAQCCDVLRSDAPPGGPGAFVPL